jgi:hypothetical protein
MITANKPEDQAVIYAIHESDRGQEVRWLLEEMAVPGANLPSNSSGQWLRLYCFGAKG